MKKISFCLCLLLAGATTGAFAAVAQVTASSSLQVAGKKHVKHRHKKHRHRKHG